MRGGGDERRARRARGDDVCDGRILGMTPTRRREPLARSAASRCPILMLRNAPSLPQVLHVLELDQDLGLGWTGGSAEDAGASCAALLALASPLPCRRCFLPAFLAMGSPPPPCSQMFSELPQHSCSTAPSRARRCSSPALLAALSLPPALADARAPRTLQPCSLPCSQMPEPPHSLHLLRCLPCSQMLPPPHSLHSLAASRARRCSSPHS